MDKRLVDVIAKMGKTREKVMQQLNAIPDRRGKITSRSEEL
jgi:hypothetical protein